MSAGYTSGRPLDHTDSYALRGEDDLHDPDSALPSRAPSPAPPAPLGDDDQRTLASGGGGSGHRDGPAGESGERHVSDVEKGLKHGQEGAKREKSRDPETREWKDDVVTFDSKDDVRSPFFVLITGATMLMRETAAGESKELDNAAAVPACRPARLHDECVGRPLLHDCSGLIESCVQCAPPLRPRSSPPPPPPSRKSLASRPKSQRSARRSSSAASSRVQSSSARCPRCTAARPSSVRDSYPCDEHCLRLSRKEQSGSADSIGMRRAPCSRDFHFHLLFGRYRDSEGRSDHYAHSLLRSVHLARTISRLSESAS